ncbi:uncharacterized protein Z518_00500 [Rhinocladiella mackenziei CBS 650.93]|uniref:L-ornithine N(5)-oxygenase n=1 Tax=Rhinocladiella mackenziei CBS 650.93 TaxID=1442369 RepID=A0A0D2JJ29_9EURO|nr:uncharacterized protein Z518_00500 [Rhinocladiella mackenziei CBS 650.93]KIX09420.1 hypothetical protein Z518_00500 [Rhinocladiella mackenziei CBS 650.93]
MAKESFDVVVVGAGWYGLIAARTYLELAPDTNLLLIDDGKTIGGVWSKERIYPDLFAQVGHGLFEYSFYPMPKEGITKDRYISGETIHKYLNDFARDYGLRDRCRLNTRVTKVESLAHGKLRWRLSVKSGDTTYMIDASKVIQASGVTSEKYVPDFPQKDFSKPIIHSGRLGIEAEQINTPQTQRVVVLGAAKSAYDTVFHLLKHGKKVDWIIREDGTGPLAISPPTQVFGLFNSVDLMGTRALGVLSPAILQAEGFWYWFLQRSSLGRTITHAFWRYLTWTAEIAAGYDKTENMKKLEPVPFKYGIFWANSGLGLASVPNFWKVLHEGDLTVHRTSIASFVDEKVVLKNGEKIAADFVILCTGWKDNLSVYDQNLRLTLGLPSKIPEDPSWKKLDAQADTTVDELLPNLVSIPHQTYENPSNREHRPWRLYRRLVSPQLSEQGDNSIVFLGQIHSVYTPLVAEMQSLWSCAYLLGQLPTPSLEDMKKEVALWNSWTAKRYLAQGRKHAYSIYDYLAYVDSLARDLGIKPNRKSNPISEMFSTYRPRDYKGILDEYCAAQKKRTSITNGDEKRVQSIRQPMNSPSVRSEAMPLLNRLYANFQKAKPVYTLLLACLLLLIAVII